MKLIEKKKDVYPICEDFRRYLKKYNRWTKLPLQYQDLLNYDSAVALYDRDGEDTLWSSIGFNSRRRSEIHNGLLEIYAILRSEGDRSVMEHLVVDRIDLCLYGNTKPLRVRIINTLNENFDYFYMKSADASRIYGLELEHLLSPSRFSFLIDTDTLIEEHIYGIPADMFIERYMDQNLNEVRLAKEFVKFNERCFLRLLGDMHSANFVVDITVDFEENMYRLRAIDFDQQCYEPRIKVYLPRYYKENNAIVDLGIKHLTWTSVRQYQREERALIRRRMRASKSQLDHLLGIMSADKLAPVENCQVLKSALEDHYKDQKFRNCRSMGELVAHSLLRLK